MIQAPQDRPDQGIRADRWWLVAGMGLAVFMASLDMSVVNLALPAVQDTFAAATSTTQWVVLGYLLPLIALALPSGRWLNGVDHRAVLVLACAGFAVSSVAAGFAPSIGWLIAARVVQGVFGSALMTLIPVLTTTAVDARFRGRAMGLVDTLGMLGLISGPAIGGLIVDSIGWPWIFHLNVPVCAALIVLAYLQLPRSTAFRRPEPGAAMEVGLLSGAACAMLIAFTMAAGRTPQWLALGLAAVPLILTWYRLPASEPMRQLLTVAPMRAPLVALTATAAATGLVFYIVPFQLLTVLRVPAPVAGVTMLAFPLAAAVLGPAAGLLADRYGARRIALAGMATLGFGLFLLMPAGQSWDAVDVAWRLAVAGAGIGLFNAPNMSAAMSASPGGLLATAGAATSVARQGGFASGPALATLVWALSGYRPGGISGVFAAAAVVVAAGAVPLARSLWPDRLRMLSPSHLRDALVARLRILWPVLLEDLLPERRRRFWTARWQGVRTRFGIMWPVLVEDLWPERRRRFWTARWQSVHTRFGILWPALLQDLRSLAARWHALRSARLRVIWSARRRPAGSTPAPHALRPAGKTAQDTHATLRAAPIGVPMTQRLRGREREERQIMRMLHLVAADTSTVLHVEGGWGSGRTRLLREAADIARRLGFTVVDGEWPPGAEPAALVGRSAVRHPVLVVLDDLHHCDPAFARSLRVLPWRLRDRPIAWLLSRRRGAGGPAADQLFAGAYPSSGRVDLRPLSPQAVGLLVSDHASGTVVGLPSILRATGGNPLLAVELTRVMQGEELEDLIRHPPMRIQASVRRGLTELSDECRRLLQVGAVLGVGFTLSDVAAVLRRPTAELLTPLDEALAADILMCDGDRLVFEQELFWRCVLLLLPHPARTALQQEAAAADVSTITDLTATGWTWGPEQPGLLRAEPIPQLGARLPGPEHHSPGWTTLSDIERKIAQLVSQGLTNQQIASHVYRSPHTVNYHLRQIFRKLDIHSRVELARLTLLHYSATEDAIDTAG